MNRENLEAKAEKTLRDTDTFRVPVAIDMVAQRLNLTMEAGASERRTNTRIRMARPLRRWSIAPGGTQLSPLQNLFL